MLTAHMTDAVLPCVTGCACDGTETCQPLCGGTTTQREVTA